MMEIQRCDKAPMGLECIDKRGHHGKCSCIKTEAFNAAMQDAEDSFLWGGFKVVPNPLMPPDDIKLVNPGNGEYDREQVEALMREQQTVGRVARVHPAVDDVEAQLAKDYALYGCSYHTVDDQGRKTRIDPTKLVIRCRGVTQEMIARAKVEQ